MATIRRGDLGRVEALGGGDDRGVDRAERQVAVARHQLGDPDGVGGVERLEDQVATREVAEEPDLGLPAEASAKEVRDLRYDERRHDERPGVRFEQLEGRCVMGVVGVDVGVERTGVDDQRDDGVSEAMISSIRPDTSLRPL
jgi:hypothetical protein